ncbi:MAG: hypothetical protein U9R23_08890 [Candidatus Cloacimonadota bacterium]|nr:hypothetical protein [Candidatus Cloacimonadota bacterium]
MKKILTILLTVLTVTVTTTFGQITTTKVAPKAEQVDNTPYDSTQNFLGKDVYKYIGQELYLKGKAESSRKYGYRGFLIDYTKSSSTNKTNVYKCCDSYNSKYDELAGKYFKVLAVHKHPKAKESWYFGKKYYLELQEKESGDKVYFEYDSQYEHLFPFIVVGFFEKQKKLVVGQEFVFKDIVLKSSTDIETGKPITTKTGQKWKCTDLTIEEEYYNLSLIIQNSFGEKTDISYNCVFKAGAIKRCTFSPAEVDENRKKFGDENFDRILQGKVKIGMTKKMCRLSWGEPNSINETITSGKKTEQWVYSDNYLYFDNGILTAIQ